jgi:hypothetical protein
VADHGLGGEGPYQAARDLLLRHAPRVGGQPLRVAGETSLTAALRSALVLDGGVLPNQGPPGSGKTYTGARMIVAMAKAGLRVGVTANSHKLLVGDVLASNPTWVNRESGLLCHSLCLLQPRVRRCASALFHCLDRLTGHLR